MKTHSITVTQDDINKGVRNDPCKCPIALAAKREFPDCDVYVGESIEVSPRGVCRDYSNIDYYELDCDGLEFIEMFDDGKTVDPIVIEVTTD